MKFRKTIVAALLAAVLLSTFAWAASPAGVRFDFETGDSGFTPIDADYPVGNGVDEFYELQHSWGAVPDGGSGLFLSGNNHSDDLFMGYVKKLTGFQPEQLYAFRVSFRLATNVAGGLIGVGGSPGSSVFVKGGITANEPKSIADDMQQHRLNIDKGNQGAGGCWAIWKKKRRCAPANMNGKTSRSPCLPKRTQRLRVSDPRNGFRF